MSTPETRLISDISRLPATLREPFEGVSFAAYMFVEAGRLDDIEQRAILDWLGIRESTFARAEEIWSERIDEELERDDTTFDELYAEILGEALLYWNRSIAPLDGDVTVWICLQRHLLAAHDPAEMVRQLGLTAGDEMRLERLWKTRLSDPAIAASAAAAWTTVLSPLPKLIIARSNFPPNVEAT